MLQIDRLPHDIKVKTINELNELLDKGYEITGTRFIWKPNFSTIYIMLERNNIKLIVDAYDIFEYAASLVELYDFNKKKPIFKYIPDSNIFWNFADNLFSMLKGEYSKPILTKKIDTKNSKSIYRKLKNWFDNEKYHYIPLSSMSEVFSLVYIVKEKQGNIIGTTYGKEILELEEISKFFVESKGYDNMIAISFFFLSKKLGRPEDYDDAILGTIVYDIKNNKTLSFNLISLVYFLETYSVNKKLGLYEIAEYLFNRSISLKENVLTFTSFIPLPFDTAFYTVLPWFSFLVLSNMKLDNENYESLQISIPQFFLYGYPGLADKVNSFNFRKFSSITEGRVTCILNFNYNTESLQYILRFDQSKGEQLVHTDFSYFEIKEKKLISHRPLNMMDVANFSFESFVAMMGAGLFDGNFNTLIKNGFKGFSDLEKKNPAYLYSLTIVYYLDQYIKWLNSNPQGYDILKKIYYKKELNAQEKEFVKKMINEKKIVI